MREAFRALVVEDEPRILRKLVEKIGILDARFEVAGTARNGMDALALARELLPDVVFSDVHMPQMDGIALTEQLRHELPDIRIVIISGYREFDYVREAMRNGVSDYLLKPLADGELARVLARVAEDLARQAEIAEGAAIRDAALGRLAEADVPRSLAQARLYAALVQAGRPDALDIHGALMCIGLEPDAFWVADGYRATHRLVVVGEEQPDLGALPQILAERSGAPVQVCALNAPVALTDIQSALHMLTAEMSRQPTSDGTRLIVRESAHNDYAQKTADEIEAYLQAHFAGDLSVESIAADMGFHAVYLNRIFKRYKGLTLIQCLINLRIDAAKALMAQNPTWDLSLVGESVGYKDPHYFSRAFKKCVGMSPSEWRERGMASM